MGTDKAANAQPHEKSGATLGVTRAGIFENMGFQNVQNVHLR